MRNSVGDVRGRPGRLIQASLYAALVFASGPLSAQAQQPTALPSGPVQTDRFHTTLIKLGKSGFTALLYTPTQPGAHARVGLVYASRQSLFDFSPAAELASRGYSVLLVKHYLADRTGERETATDGVAEASAAIAWFRASPEVQRVVLAAKGDDARLAALYANAARNGPAICQRPDLLYPCKGEDLSGIEKPDGLILLDPGLGPVTTAIGVDPSFEGTRRSKVELDIFAAVNGYDGETRSASYSTAFLKRFFIAQSARNQAIVDRAKALLATTEQGKGAFSDDAPLVVAGAVNSGTPANPADADSSLLSRTKRPHILLKRDGSTATAIIHSLRQAAGPTSVSSLSPCCGSISYTVRRFLANDAIRTTPDFALRVDDVTGVEWSSAASSVPYNAAGVFIPTLIVAMTCSADVVPAEIVYDHLAAADRTYVAVEGASDAFAPCATTFGDTRERTFDFVDQWLARKGRF